MMSGSVFHKSISGSRFKTPQQNFYCYLLEAIWSISSCLENVCATHIGNRWEKNKSGKPTSSAAASEVLLKWALYLNTIEEPSSQCCHGNRGTLDSDEKVHGRYPCRSSPDSDELCGVCAELNGEGDPAFVFLIDPNSITQVQTWFLHGFRSRLFWVAPWEHFRMVRGFKYICWVIQGKMINQQMWGFAPWFY